MRKKLRREMFDMVSRESKHVEGRFWDMFNSMAMCARCGAWIDRHHINKNSRGIEYCMYCWEDICKKAEEEKKAKK